MNQQKYWIAKISDKTICELVEQLDPPEVTLTVIGASNTSFADYKNNELWSQLKENDAFAIGRINFWLPGVNVDYYSGGYKHWTDQNSIAPEPYLDEIVLGNRGGVNTVDAISSINRIQAAFWPVSKAAELRANSAPTSVSSVLAQSTLQRLETLNAQLVETGIDYRRKVDEEVDAKLMKSAADHDAQIKIIRDEYLQKKSGLDDKERELEERRNKLDDRDNTHARRQIRDKMLDDVKDRIKNFGVSEATLKKRIPVRAAMWALILIIFSLLGFTVYEVANYDKALNAVVYGEPKVIMDVPKAISGGVVDKIGDKSISNEAASGLLNAFVSQRWLLWIRLLFVSFAFAACFIYYIRWENGWAQRHADAEFNLQQFYIDVNRANWVVESCLEWHKTTAQPIPEELLSGISRDLFVSSNQKQEQVVHPADELASALLGTASRVKIKAGESEVELKNPGKSLPKTVPVKAGAD